MPSTETLEPESTPPIDALNVELLQPESEPMNTIVHREDIDLRDGINTESEIIAANIADVAIEGSDETSTEAVPVAAPTSSAEEDWGPIDAFAPASSQLPVAPVTEVLDENVWFGRKPSEAKAQAEASTHEVDPAQSAEGEAAATPASDPTWSDYLIDEGYKEYRGRMDMDSDKVRAAQPFIEQYWQQLQNTKDNSGKIISDPEKISRLASAAAILGCERKSEIDPQSSMDLLAGMAEQGVDAAQVIDFVRNEENAALLVQAFERDPDSLTNPDSSIGMVIRVSKLPLSELVPEAGELNYGDSSLDQHKDHIIEGLVENSEVYRYPELVTTLEQKLPQLEESGFKTSLIGQKILARFNQSLAANMVGNDLVKGNYEGKLLDYCTQLGKTLDQLGELDASLPGQIIDGAFRQIERGEKPDIELIGTTTEKLSQLQAENGEPNRIFAQFRRMEKVKGLKGINQWISISERIATSPHLSRLVEGEEVTYADNGVRSTASAEHLRSIADACRNLELRKGQEGVEEYFAKLDGLQDLLNDERIDAVRLLGIANQALEKEDVSAFVNEVKQPAVQEAFNDPQLAKALNESLGVIAENPKHSDATRALEMYKQVENKNYFELYRMIKISSELSNSGGEQAEHLNDMFYDLVGKASKRVDKNGYPYDGIEVVRSAVHLLARIGSIESQKETLSWFEQGNLPYATLQPILSIRDEAVAAGAADNPQAIYDWMFENPERIEAQSRKNRDSYLGAGSVRSQEDIELAAREAAEKQEDFRILLNIRQAPLTSAIEQGGDLQSMFDGVIRNDQVDGELGQRHASYKIRRSGVEIALGIRSLDSDEEHPIYGSCAFIDQGVPTGAYGYGDIVLVFKSSDRLEENTTFTPEDSFHGANRLTMEDAQTVRHMKDKEGIGYMRTDDYVEAQIRGGLNISEVEQIVVNSKEQADALKATLQPEIADRVKIREPED